MSGVTSTASRLSKKKELEVLAEATTLKSSSVDELQKYFRKNFSQYLKEHDINYRDLAKKSREVGASPEFCFTKNIKTIIEGTSPITIKFANEIGCVLSQFYNTRIINFVPFRRMQNRVYLDIANRAFENHTENPKEAKFAVQYKLYAYTIGAVA